MSTEDPEDMEPPKTGSVSALDLIPCVGLCCCFFSCYTELPSCLGSVCQGNVCCIQQKSMLCKVSQEEDSLCKFLSCDCDCISCSELAKLRVQICCLDGRLSCPPSDDVPCLLTILCCTLCYRYKCACKFAKNIRSINNEVMGEVNPEPEWRQEVDPKSKRIYFVNNYTGKSQWETPENYAP